MRGRSRKHHRIEAERPGAPGNPAEPRFLVENGARIVFSSPMTLLPRLRLIWPVLACGFVYPPGHVRRSPSRRRHDARLYRHLHGRKEQGHLRLPLRPRHGPAQRSRVGGGNGQPELSGAPSQPAFPLCRRAKRATWAASASAPSAPSAWTRRQASSPCSTGNPPAARGRVTWPWTRPGKCLLVANYGSGSIAALPIQADGALAEPGTIIQHQGSSVNPRARPGPTPISSPPTPPIGSPSPATSAWTRCSFTGLTRPKPRSWPMTRPLLPSKPGSGPRHLAFHPSGRFVFLINEMSSTLTAFAYDAKRGALKELQTVSTLPETFAGDKLRRGSAGASLREICLWLKSRPRQHRGLRLRPQERQTDLRGAPSDSGQNAAALCH